MIRSQVIWEEVKKKGRWKALKLRQCEELEAAWQKIQQQLAVGKEPQYRQKVGDLEVGHESIAQPPGTFRCRGVCSLV